MKENRAYTRQELEGVAFMLSDMMRNHAVFLAQAEDMKRANPWLAELIMTLEYSDNYIDMVECGSGKATLDGAVFRITLPTECITDGERGLWGDTVPIEFHFSTTSSGYKFVRSLSNEERATARNL